jgi:predicted HTH domain antitoxin
MMNIPDEPGITLQLKGDALANEMIRLAIIKLYELGKFSSGKAAQMLGISRVAFLELCGAYEVSVIGNMTVEELKADVFNIA